ADRIAFFRAGLTSHSACSISSASTLREAAAKPSSFSEYFLSAASPPFITAESISLTFMSISLLPSEGRARAAASSAAPGYSNILITQSFFRWVLQVSLQLRQISGGLSFPRTHPP